MTVFMTVLLVSSKRIHILDTELQFGKVKSSGHK